MHVTLKVLQGIIFFSSIYGSSFLLEETWFQFMGEKYQFFQFILHIYIFFYCFWFQVFLCSCLYPGEGIQWAENWIFLAWLMKKQSMCFRWFSEISAFVRKKRKGWGKIKNTNVFNSIFGSLQAGFGEAEEQRCFGLLCRYTLNNWADIRSPQFDPWLLRM